MRGAKKRFGLDYDFNGTAPFAAFSDISLFFDGKSIN